MIYAAYRDTIPSLVVVPGLSPSDSIHLSGSFARAELHTNPNSSQDRPIGARRQPHIISLPIM